jgi:hypothetical protein
MKVRQAVPEDQETLLELMYASHHQANSAFEDEWSTTKSAVITLLNDPLAGEAYLILNEQDMPIGYMVMCRGFSLDYGGYFTWLEESYVQQSEQGLFRDQRFSP